MMRTRYIGWFLFWIALVIVIITFPFGMIYSRIVRNKSDWNKLNRDLAIILDKMGNIFLQDILNTFFIKEDGYKSGKNETISSVLGKNKKKGTLKYLGILLDKILNKIDNDHSIKSISHDV